MRRLPCGWACRWLSRRPALLWSCLLWVATVPVQADLSPSWPDLDDLTPESLTHCFADFAFELSDDVQEANQFLQRKRGDCADFAKLVSEVLSRHRYNSKLVVVMMERQTHVVCYVKERDGYLDYNLRAAAEPIVRSTEALEDIADKVADSFRSKWRMASEIRYEGVTPVFVLSTFPQAPATSPAPTQLPDKAVSRSTTPQPTTTAAEVSVEKTADAKPSGSPSALAP
jgi:hypothetical protein